MNTASIFICWTGTLTRHCAPRNGTRERADNCASVCSINTRINTFEGGGVRLPDYTNRLDGRGAARIGDSRNDFAILSAALSCTIPKLVQPEVRGGHC